MSNWFKTKDIKKIPKIELPKGYTVRPARPNEKGELCERDKQAWIHLQEVRGYSQEKVDETLSRLEPHSRGWIVTQWLKTPCKAEGVVFVEFNGEIVGCVCAVQTAMNDIEYHHAMVLPEHRRKGLYKAMMGYCLQYTIDKGIERIYLAPNTVLWSYWKRVFGEN